MATREESMLALKEATGRKMPGELDTIDLIRFRAKRMIGLLETYPLLVKGQKWPLPDVIKRNELRMLREAIEKWEAEQKEV